MGIHELIGVESNIYVELHITHLKSVAMNFELDSIGEGPTNVTLLHVEGRQELQSELIISRLLYGKEGLPGAKRNELLNLCS